jgi:hypothetical protein
MNALTAPLSATTPKTSATATADGVGSTTAKTIDAYIKERLQEATSADFSGLKSSAETARRLGFTSSANSRYADFLESFRAALDQTRYYTEKYPACYFLPWAAVRSIIQSLQLWCDLPEHYMGAVPPEQLPWLDLFALDSADLAQPTEIVELIPEIDKKLFISMIEEVTGYPWDKSASYSYRASSIAQHHSTEIRAYVKQFRSSFFILAPPEAFKVKEDFRERFRKMMKQAEQRQTTPPDDPIAVRFVKGGALVVAAWGDEAAELNARVAALNL